MIRRRLFFALASLAIAVGLPAVFAAEREPQPESQPPPAVINADLESVAVPAPLPAPQVAPARFHYLALYDRVPEGDPDGRPEAWVCPQDCLGSAYDLRSLALQGQTVISGWGWFVYDAARDICPSGCATVGEMLSSDGVTFVAAGRTNLEISLGISLTESTDLIATFQELVTTKGDADGATRWKNALGSRTYLGDQVIDLGEARSRVRWDSVLGVLHDDYRVARASAIEQGDRNHLKLIDKWSDDYGVSQATFVPRDQPYEGYAIHASSEFESFDCADRDLSVGCDQSWTEVSGDTDIVSNEMVTQTSARGRAAGSLSSANMYAQIIFTANPLNDSRALGITARQDTAAATYYVCFYRIRAAGATWLYKSVSASYTLITTGSTGSFSFPARLKLETDGSAQECFLDDVSVATGGDSAISGFTRGGFDAGLFGCCGQTADDWCITDNLPGTDCADAAATPAAGDNPIVIFLTH